MKAWKAIVNKDLKDFGPRMGALLLAAASAVLTLALVWNEESSDLLFAALVFTIQQSVAAVLILLLILKEKNSGTWPWLQSMASNQSTLMWSKFAIFAGGYVLFAIALLPGWLVAGLPWDLWLRLLAWSATSGIGFAFGCTLFAVAVIVKRALNALLLSFAASHMAVLGVVLLVILDDATASMFRNALVYCSENAVALFGSVVLWSAACLTIVFTTKRDDIP